MKQALVCNKWVLPFNLKIENEDDVSLHNRSYMHYVANHIELVSTKCWATKWLLENIIESDKEYSVREYMSGIGIQTLLIQKLFNVNKHTISELDENCIKHLSLVPFDVKPEILHENAEESLLKNDNSDLKFLDLPNSSILQITKSLITFILVNLSLLKSSNPFSSYL